MIPPRLMAKRPNISNKEIYLINGATIVVAGLDQPARIEGAPSDGFLFDETDDIKRSAWEEHIDPMFIDRSAWAMYTGVPNGLAYLYEISKNALKFPDEWDFFTWKSAEVMNPAEVKKFQDRMDPRSFAQEFEASFENFTGRVYYAFTRENYKHELLYNPNKPLIICLDFNSSPGVAVICQEQELPGQFEEVQHNGVWIKQPVVGTGVIGEVHIPQNSNTLIVCRRLYEDWKHHKGEILVYGDPAGGQKKSSGVQGSDWDLIKDFFKTTSFADRISYEYPRSHPPVKKRINSMNSRFCSVTGVRRMMVDAFAAPKLIEDLEQLSILEGSDGEIDTKKNKKIGHMCFSGDTEVITDRGVQRLDSISDSGKIMGYDGKMYHYSNGGKRLGTKETIALHLSSGEQVICTPDHRFLSEYGWTKAIDLLGKKLYNGLLCSKKGQPLCKNKSLWTEFLSCGTGNTTKDILTAKKLDCMFTFGSGLTGRFRRGSVFTTKTKIDLIMTLRTSKLCHSPTTCDFTCKTKAESRLQETRSECRTLSMGQDNGTQAKRGECGILNTQYVRQPNGRKMNLRAQYAEINLCQNANAKTLCFALTLAPRKSAGIQAKTIFQHNALLAVKHFRSTNTQLKNIVLTNAGVLVPEALRQNNNPSLCRALIAAKCLKDFHTKQKSIATENAFLKVEKITKHKTIDVFCPTVETGCFLLKNGLLVSNSDALGYYVTEVFPIDGSDMCNVIDL